MVCRGEGENSLLELADFLANSSVFKKLKKRLQLDMMAIETEQGLMKKLLGVILFRLSEEKECDYSWSKFMQTFTVTHKDSMC